MLSQEQIDMVVKHVESKMQNMESFTAYDITTAIRDELRSAGGWIHHYEVKPFVHELFYNREMGTYTRSFIDTPTGQAFLYHDVSKDPEDYTEEHFGTPKSTTDDDYDDLYTWTGDDLDDNPISLVNSMQSSAITSNDPPHYITDNRHRICVPKAMLEEVGCFAGDGVLVEKKDDLITITPATSKQTHLVDKSGNVRIKIPENSDTAVSIEVINGVIRIDLFPEW